MCEMCEIPIDLPLQRQKNALAGADAKRNVGHPMELWPGLSRTSDADLKTNRCATTSDRAYWRAVRFRKSEKGR